MNSSVRQDLVTCCTGVIIGMCDMKIIGITGGVGAGKSTILDYLERQYDAYILKSDEAAREIQLPGGAIYDQVRTLLEKYPTGQELLNPDGTFCRPEVAQRIFHNADLLGGINAIVHPAVRAYIEQVMERERMAGRSYFVLESALLVESGYRTFVDTTWYIYCNEDTRRERLRESRGYSDERTERIMANQLSEEAFRAGSDVVIDNSGTPEETWHQIDAAMAECRM